MTSVDEESNEDEKAVESESQQRDEHVYAEVASTSSNVDFRELILERLEQAHAKSRQFEPIFQAYSSMAEDLVKTKRSRARTRSEAVSGESSARVADLERELADLYKKKGINDQALLERTRELEDCRRQLAVVNEGKSKLETDIRKFTQRIAELEVELQKVREENSTILDECISLKTRTNVLQEKVLDLDRERVVLITKIRELQAKEAAKLDDELDKHTALQRKKIQDQIAAAMAATAAEDGAGDRDDASAQATAAAPCSVGDQLPTRVHHKFEGNDGEVTDVLWLREGMAATGGSDRKVNLWNVIDGNASKIGTLLGCNQTITRLDMCKEDPKLILASCNDQTVRIWNVDSLRQMFVLSGHTDKVSVARFCNLTHAVSGSTDRMIKLWDVRNSKCLKSFFPGSTVLDLVARPASHCFISGHFDKKVRVWDGRTAEPAQIVELGAKVTGLYLGNDDKQLLCCARNDTLSLLDLRTLSTQHIYSAEQYRTACDTARCVISPDGTYCAAGSMDGSIFIWNLRTTKLEKQLFRGGHDSSVMSIAWCPTGRGLLSVDRHKTVCYWE